MGTTLVLHPSFMEIHSVVFVLIPITNQLTDQPNNKQMETGENVTSCVFISLRIHPDFPTHTGFY